jgi:hypothetical protein
MNKMGASDAALQRRLGVCQPRALNDNNNDAPRTHSDDREGFEPTLPVSAGFQYYTYADWSRERRIMYIRSFIHSFNKIHKPRASECAYYLHIT